MSFFAKAAAVVEPSYMDGAHLRFFFSAGGQKERIMMMHLSSLLPFSLVRFRGVGERGRRIKRLQKPSKKSLTSSVIVSAMQIARLGTHKEKGGVDFFSVLL